MLKKQNTDIHNTKAPARASIVMMAPPVFAKSLMFFVFSTRAVPSVYTVPPFEAGSVAFATSLRSMKFLWFAD